MVVPLVAALLSCAAVPRPAQAQSADYFLKLSGITGESTDRNHAGWQAVDSFSWRVTNASSIGGGSGGSAGKPVFSDFRWSQRLDASFAPMFVNLATGKRLARATFDVQTRGPSPTVFFKMTFENVQLTDLSIYGYGSRPGVDAAFDYTKVTLTYWAQKPDGSLGTRYVGSFDRLAGTTFRGSATVFEGLALATAGDAGGPSAIRAPVPEPQTWALLACGLGVVGAAAARRRPAAATCNATDAAA
jgi:type VI secretion system secreted protein Hcp